MDILLIQPPIQDFYLTGKRTLPYGLSGIATCLRASGFTVDILDGLSANKSRPLPTPTEMSYLDEFYGRPDTSPFRLFHQYRHFGYSFQYLEKRIRESGAFLVGISSLFTAYAQEAQQLCGIVKQSLPRAKVVVGGHHPTALPREVMDWDSLDFAIRGDGEAALPALAEAIQNDWDVSSVPGIVFRKPHGDVHISPPAVADNLDALPAPDPGFINNAYYSRARQPSAVIVTSRGCPFTCSYCSLGNRSLYPYRQRSVDAVMAELHRAVEHHGVRFIDFEDENLSIDHTWFMELLQRLRLKFGDKGLELRAMNGLYPPSLDQALIAAMKAAGFKTLNLSLAATCPDQLKRFRRKDVRRTFETCLDLAQKYSLTAVGYVICSAPGQHAMQSLEDLLYLAQRRVLLGLSVYYPAPGSKDYDVLAAKGMLPTRTSLFRSSTVPISQTTSRLETVTLMRLSRIINYMKYIMDRGGSLPAPERITETRLPATMDRNDIGEYLLAGFLEDGGIRGVTPGHQIYCHRTDPTLVSKFLHRLKEITIRGTS